MKIITTPNELMNNGMWEKYCILTGTNEWALNEGLMSGDEEIILTKCEAQKLRLISYSN